MTLQVIADTAGGIGLFLLGMMLMTDGLKLAAGQALRHILAEWTRTPLRGLLSGVLITSLVQSSSAVTVATIGFVNAGLLDLLQTIYVIFGSNIGTTMTSWLVALVGFKVDVKALALPLIAVGMVLRLTSGTTSRGALGTALAGFGLFFLGIDVLKDTFTALGDDFPVERFAREGFLGVLLFLGIGFALTLLMQSSSAAMAITLTAAAGGLVPLTDAAAVVIGANLGTTSTAALAVIGATPNAQRVAAAHVLFNCITGLVALLILEPMLAGIGVVRTGLGLDDSPATTLALYHTTFNLFGVALLWPFTPRLVRFLDARFHRAEEDLARPRFLDKNVVSTPSLGLDALAMELGRIGALARTMAKSCLSVERIPSGQLKDDERVLGRLADAVRQFVVTLQRANLPPDLVAALPTAIRVGRYYEETAEMAVLVANAQRQLGPVEDRELAAAMAQFRGECVRLVEAGDPERPEFTAAELDPLLAELEQNYQALKALLLRVGARGRLPVRQMVGQLDQYSAINRMVEQVLKGAQHLHAVRDLAARYRQPAPAATADAPAGGQ